MVEAKPFYTTQEVAERLGVNVQRVRRLAKERHVGIKPTPRSSWLFSEEEVQYLLGSRSPKGGRPVGIAVTPETRARLSASVKAAHAAGKGRWGARTATD